MAIDPDNRSTVTVSKDTLSRLKQHKPYDTMNSDEFINELLDNYNSEVTKSEMVERIVELERKVGEVGLSADEFVTSLLDHWEGEMR